MDDYLKTGGVKHDLENFNKYGINRQQTRKEELYLSGYGRQWGEKLTYSTGLAYGSGMLIGGSYGFVVGIRKGGATRRLFLNTLLNSCSTHGPYLANQCGVITMFYCGFNNLLGLINFSDETVNSPIAGALAGALYKLSGSWKARATYSIASSAVFSIVNYASRSGYL